MNKLYTESRLKVRDYGNKRAERQMGGELDLAVQEKRPRPLVHMSWLARLLSLDSQCLYAHWVKAHYLLPKSLGDPDPSLIAWNHRHNDLLIRRVLELREAGWRVFTEGLNALWVDIEVEGAATGVTLSGQPDIVAARMVSGTRRLRIEDVKAGQPKNADLAQVRLYLKYFPISRKLPDSIRLEGALLYGEQDIPIETASVSPFTETGRAFAARCISLVEELAQDEPPPKSPSFRECRYCPVTSCPKRLDERSELDIAWELDSETIWALDLTDSD